MWTWVYYRQGIVSQFLHIRFETGHMIWKWYMYLGLTAVLGGINQTSRIEFLIVHITVFNYIQFNLLWFCFNFLNPFIVKIQILFIDLHSVIKCKLGELNSWHWSGVILASCKGLLKQNVCFQQSSWLQSQVEDGKDKIHSWRTQECCWKD